MGPRGRLGSRFCDACMFDECMMRAWPGAISMMKDYVCNGLIVCKLSVDTVTGLQNEC